MLTQRSFCNDSCMQTQEMGLEQHCFAAWLLASVVIQSGDLLRRKKEQVSLFVAC